MMSVKTQWLDVSKQSISEWPDVSKQSIFEWPDVSKQSISEWPQNRSAQTHLCSQFFNDWMNLSILFLTG